MSDPKILTRRWGTVAVYPGWTTPALMLGMGAFGGSAIGFLTAAAQEARVIEGFIAALAAIVLTSSLVERRRFRKAARESYASQGGDPTVRLLFL